MLTEYFRAGVKRHKNTCQELFQFKRIENYKWSDAHSLEKREPGYVGCGRSKKVTVARPKSRREFSRIKPFGELVLSRKGSIDLPGKMRKKKIFLQGQDTG